MRISPSLTGCGADKNSHNTGRRAPLPLLRALVLFDGLLGSLAGCANPGPPKPPSLHLPSPPRDLRAERIGDQVQLTWTTAAETTDGLPANLPLFAEICRDLRASPPSPAPADPSLCTVVQHLAVAPGPSKAADLLPAPLVQDPAQLLRYRVRVLNAAGRGADPSNIAFAAAGTAPPPVNDLRAASSARGVNLLWQPLDQPAAAIFLQRVLLSTPARPPTQQAKPSRAGERSSPALTAQTVRLTGAPAGPDRGGLLDLSGQRDATYSYVAWRSRIVVLEGKSLTLRSPDSAPLTFTLRDTTPPAVPAGLAALADGLAVDLSWEPNTEPDFAGYWVERSPASEAATSSAPQTWQRINQSLLQAPAYRDQPVAAGSLLYRVLAADASGNLSQPTSPILVTVRPLSVP